MELQLTDVMVNGVVVKGLSSRVVAEMIGKQHSDVLKMLEGKHGKNGKGSIVGIIPTLSQSNITLAEFFIEATYKDTQGKQRKEYICTKKGCEMLANKLTGEKGILFTARYVEAFNEMEQQLQEIKNVVDGKGELTKDEFYDIHFGNGKRIRMTFEKTNDYTETFNEFMEFARTLDVDERIKRYEHLQRVLNDILIDKVRDLNLSVSQVMDVRITLGDMQLKLEEKINEARNRSYGAKLKFAKRK